MNEFSPTTTTTPNPMAGQVGTPLSTTPTLTPPTGNRQQEASRLAAEMFRQDPDWVTFFREILGVDGIVRRLFPDAQDLAEFEKTEQYVEIQNMLNQLREGNRAKADGKEPTRVITVRLPASLHESLRAEAHNKQTSMNQLCISKLLQVLAGQLQELQEEQQQQ